MNATDPAHLRDLEHGALHRFSDWDMNQVPNWRAGVYTIWDGDVE